MARQFLEYLQYVACQRHGHEIAAMCAFEGYLNFTGARR